MIIYYIYHLPHFVWKDGSIGKIGVSEKPKRRTKKQGYTEYEILEEHTNIILVSYREKTLQKEYGYKVDNNFYYQTRLNQSLKGSIKGGVSARESGQLKNACIKGGEVQGPKNVESGHMDKIRLLGNIKTSKPILVYRIDGNFVGEYPSGRECSRQLNLNPSCITDVLKGNQYQTKGYVIKYKT
jgi:hypothetical protein